MVEGVKLSEKVSR